MPYANSGSLGRGKPLTTPNPKPPGGAEKPPGRKE